MKTPIFAALLSLGLALGLPSIAVADADFYCGSTIIEEGMMLTRVQQLCGPPTEQTGDRWIYDRGPEEFTVIIHVSPDGTVGLIEQEQQDD
jgi:hypothetical protein